MRWPYRSKVMVTDELPESGLELLWRGHQGNRRMAPAFLSTLIMGLRLWPWEAKPGNEPPA